MRIGVLALQGDFAEHLSMLRQTGTGVREVRLPEQLEGLDGLIIPGGESTTIGKLAATFGLIDPLRDFAARHPVWGTCAGAILLSRDAQRDQPLLGVMNITVERNAFGRQVDSFETNVLFPVLDDPQRPFHAVFIRAPLIASAGKGVEILAQLSANRDQGRARIVAARQGHLLATSFHPELTGDDRVHRYFLSLAKA
ncbi:MAG: pyridoxal 5'-phosphate synthase glutaminase subunit PdxT [Anaerolineales bacterium]|nr:pyridoxal 5'-phosphate synthase glutaminase subunit PdxT [Anaerolineales bacterium]